MRVIAGSISSYKFVDNRYRHMGMGLTTVQPPSFRPWIGRKPGPGMVENVRVLDTRLRGYDDG